MTNKLKHYAMALLLGSGLTVGGSVAQADDPISFFADIGVFSQYLARSVPQGGGETSVQGDIGFEHESGVSVAAWFATGVGTDTEYDFTLDYSGESGDLAYSIGYYTISYIDTPADNGGEFYVALSYDMISTAAYVAKDYNYYELGLAYTVADSIDTSLIGGYDDSLQKADITFALSTDFEVGAATFTPSLAIAKLDGAKIEYVAGLNISF